MKFLSKKKKDEEEKKISRHDTVQQAPTDKSQAKTRLERQVPPSAGDQQRKQVAVQKEQNIKQSDKLRLLIQLMSGAKENRLDPVINFDESRISYPQLAQIGLDPRDVTILEKLAAPSVRIIERGVYERLPVCPKHPQSLATTLRLYCPTDSSLDIRKLQLTEHKICGHIAERKKFVAELGSDTGTCPSCRKKIVDEKRELRMHGMWYECMSCKEKFDNPVNRLHCIKFNHDFDVNQAEMIIIPYYKLREQTKKVYVDIFTITPQVKKLLTSYRFAAEDSASIKGKSGVAHTASLYGYNKENKTILIDIKGSETEIDDAEVTSTFVKVLDIRPTIAIFIGIPSISKRARAMATAHNISIVTGKNSSEIVAAADAVLSRHISKAASTVNKPE